MVPSGRLCSPADARALLVALGLIALVLIIGNHEPAEASPMMVGAGAGAGAEAGAGQDKAQQGQLPDSGSSVQISNKQSLHLASDSTVGGDQSKRRSGDFAAKDAAPTKHQDLELEEGEPEEKSGGPQRSAHQADPNRRPAKPEKSNANESVGARIIKGFGGGWIG